MLNMNSGLLIEMIILGGLIISGCANAVPQNKETASWTLEGMFVDDIENPACILGIEHKTSEDGSEDNI